MFTSSTLQLFNCRSNQDEVNLWLFIDFISFLFDFWLNILSFT